ncbi:hypothetical protein J6590_052795 [Homalodisca vitripennis]|nr:hypothetical protein J6590_052795 [Homalodisca vitripennis]
MRPGAWTITEHNSKERCLCKAAIADWCHIINQLPEGIKISQKSASSNLARLKQLLVSKTFYSIDGFMEGRLKTSSRRQCLS